MFRYLGIFLCSLAVLSAEPSCSRFHYEEQTLKKMIMVEMLVEKFKADNEETKGYVRDTLSEISNERAESVKKLERITFRVADVENSLKDLKDDAGVTHVVQFRARGIQNKSPISKETLVFATIMSNNGSAYDKTTGVFTAPVAGLYMFNLHLCIVSNKHLYFEIVVNDQAFFKGLVIDDSSPNASFKSYSASVLLSATDKVSVKAARTSGDALWGDNSEVWNMFDGFLVHTI